MNCVYRISWRFRLKAGGYFSKEDPTNYGPTPDYAAARSAKLALEYLRLMVRSGMPAELVDVEVHRVH